MKKWLGLLLCILLLVGCAGHNTETAPEYTAEPKDYDPAAINYGLREITAYHPMTVSENGIYIALVKYLFFIDFDSGEAVFLCNKPNCAHAYEPDQLIGQECNAYLMNVFMSSGFLDNFYLQYYNHYLFSFQNDFDFNEGISETVSLVRIAEDGSSREVMKTFSSSARRHVAFLKNNVYYIDADGKVYYKSIDSLANDPEYCLDDESHFFSGVKNFITDNDSIYIIANQYTDGDQTVDNALIAYTPKEEKYTLIASGPINGGAINFINFIDENTLVYAADNQLYYYRLDDGETGLFLDNANAVYPSGQYLFTYNGFRYLSHLDEEEILRVYDRDLNLLAEREMTNEVVVAIGAYDEKFYICEQASASVYEIVYEYSYQDGSLERNVFFEYDNSDSPVQGFTYQRGY